MSPEEPASVLLVDAMIGRSHERLSGEIKVLAEAQRGAAESQRFTAELSSIEHNQVRDAIELIGAKLDRMSVDVAELKRAEGDDLAVERWRRRAIAGASGVVGLALTVAGLLLAYA